MGGRDARGDAISHRAGTSLCPPLLRPMVYRLAGRPHQNEGAPFHVTVRTTISGYLKKKGQDFTLPSLPHARGR